MSCGCGGEKKDNKKELKQEKYIDKFMETNIGSIPVVSTNLKYYDILGAWKVRWGINRMKYEIDPGIYAVGNPDEESNVFVTANYKFSFDMLRKELNNMDAWILVLDTKGINVWCAAGKGTFGTEELIKRIIDTKLLKLIKHSTLILPQLGAVGIDANNVRKNTGMKIIYGPVYAKDIKDFIANNYMKNEKMRTVSFNFRDRAAVIPVEITGSIMLLFILFAASSILRLVEIRTLNFSLLIYFIPFLGAYLCGTFLTPLLLPYIPFKSFAIKGFLVGLIWAISASWILKFSVYGYLVNILLLAPISSFLAMNFTGASTFTSLTGVKKEIKFAIPLFALSLFFGLSLKVLTIINII